MSYVFVKPEGPLNYLVQDKPIPHDLTLEQRKAVLTDLNVPPEKAAAVAMQDRSSQLITQLLYLLENTGSCSAKELAYIRIKEWNTECDEFLNQK